MLQSWDLNLKTYSKGGIKIWLIAEIIQDPNALSVQWVGERERDRKKNMENVEE